MKKHPGNTVIAFDTLKLKALSQDAKTRELCRQKLLQAIALMQKSHDELISNAIKFIPGEPTIIVDVSKAQSNKMISVCLKYGSRNRRC